MSVINTPYPNNFPYIMARIFVNFAFLSKYSTHIITAIMGNDTTKRGLTFSAAKTSKFRRW